VAVCDSEYVPVKLKLKHKSSSARKKR